MWVLSAPECGTLSHLDFCPSHASVVQPPTSLWSEDAGPVCMSLDQVPHGSNLRCFSGAGEGKKGVDSKPQFSLETVGFRARASPLLGDAALWR